MFNDPRSAVEHEQEQVRCHESYLKTFSLGRITDARGRVSGSPICPLDAGVAVSPRRTTRTLNRLGASRVLHVLLELDLELFTYGAGAKIHGGRGPVPATVPLSRRLAQRRPFAVDAFFLNFLELPFADGVALGDDLPGGGNIGDFVLGLNQAGENLAALVQAQLPGGLRASIRDRGGHNIRLSQSYVKRESTPRL